ncbi:kinase-like domain-containing protein [Bisporella sp. PMI_857]|nr:kinase-like domain-containing protein [Bisporella sp. PMI_857]
MEQWGAYSDSAGGSRRYNGNANPPPNQQPPGSRDYNGGSQSQPSSTFNYSQYQGGMGAHGQPVGSSPATTPNMRDGNGDIAMSDAGVKYPMRPHHQQHLSGSRIAVQHSAGEVPSAAAQRYSPMETLSPTSPYGASQGQNYSAQVAAQRQSPTRPGNYSSPGSYYTSRQQTQQLPPITPYSSNNNNESYPNSATQQLNAVFGNDTKSTRRPGQQNAGAPPGKGPVPEFSRVRTLEDLRPKVNAQPAFRRANPEGGFISPLQALTSHLPSTYRICNPSFKYESSRNPRRVLTKPSKGVKNDGFDNEDSDYILYVNDILGSEETGHKNRYLILDVLGQGTFGQVVKCQNLKTQEVVAVKVVKNRTAYFNQSMMEVSVLDLLNTKLDKNDDHHLLRLKDTFIHRQHLCLVFELLSVNLYELIKQNQFRGLSTTLVRVFAQQLLNGLSLLNKARLIHCDLKPENILLKNLESPIIKIIDFGSACDERQTVYTYIQSRFYRSPEVLLGLPYSSAIDMWSLGCIVVELFLGLPLFPGSSEYNQVSRIVEMLGNPPTWMLEMGKQSGEFFEKRHDVDDYGRRTYHLKSMEQYSREHGTKEQPSKKYFQATQLPDIIRSYAMPRKNMKPNEIEREMSNRVAFIDFVRGLLNINPLERWSPQQAKMHPFITQQKYTGPFVPPMNLKSSSINRSPAPGTQQQQQAEALSKQRAQASQSQVHAQAHAQAHAAPPNPYAPSTMTQYPQAAPPQVQQPQNYNMYAGNINHQGAPPPYPSQQQPGPYGQMGMSGGMHQQPPAQMPPAQYGQGPPQVQQSLYAQATMRSGRQRASTMEVQQGGIPATIQRVASHLDPNQPIRLQPSPAYYPPPPDGVTDGNPGSARRRGSRAAQGGQTGPRNNQNFVRTLEDRTLEEGFMAQSQWH